MPCLPTARTVYVRRPPERQWKVPAVLHPVHLAILEVRLLHYQLLGISCTSESDASNTKHDDAPHAALLHGTANDVPDLFECGALLGPQPVTARVSRQLSSEYVCSSPSRYTMVALFTLRDRKLHLHSQLPVASPTERSRSVGERQFKFDMTV